MFLGITWKGMTLVIRLDVSIWDETYLRFGFLVLHIRNYSRPLPQYEDLMLLVSHCLTQYKAVRHLVCLPLPQYEVHLPRHEISSQFQGSSRWCLITSVAKFFAALYAFVAAVCSGSSSLNVFSNFCGFISLNSTHGLYKGQLDSTKSTSPKTLRSRQALVADSCSITKSGRSQQQSVSPRRQPKKLGFERQSPPTTPKSEPGKIQRRLGRQQMESVSPRRKQGIKPRSTLQQPDERLGHASSDLRSLRTDSNISLGSSVDIEVTSRHRLERNCGFPELHTPNQKSPDFGIRQDRPSLKPLKVTVEQPSPVSVLDAAFDEEDSPSPVRKISLTFKEDDALRSEESVWIKKPASICRSIILPENNRNATQADSDLLKCYPEEDASGDHKYISEILLASGLLRDLEYSMMSIQLNKARLPINPGLFFILEQNKGMGLRQHQTNPTEIIRRKLIFDTVNEILAQRFTAEGCTKPRLTANPITKMENISKGEQLLKTLCLEIDRLQENNSQCILEDDKEDLKWNDLQCHGMNLKAFEGETPGIVLDIERMIFRDLVNEVCFC
ncbi:hypothetical protein F2Q69_00002920 [Brassica cretica]|uniref:DUF4378 domain-containing protein n=1 Tax=Brassica cretica TaxID=69181 RepID=A0A8S9PGR0_BRACR|nr:hypothetical protein F2Q69_00002920 [Brassica cretica]